MDDVIIKWVPAGTESDHDGWRVIGKPKQDENGQLLVPLARDADGIKYVQFDDDPTMFGVSYEMDMDKLNKLSNAQWLTHGFDDQLKPLREIALPQYYIFPNMKIGKKEDFVADVIGRPLIDPLSQGAWEDDSDSQLTVEWAVNGIIKGKNEDMLQKFHLTANTVEMSEAETIVKQRVAETFADMIAESEGYIVIMYTVPQEMHSKHYPDISPLMKWYEDNKD